MDYTIYDFLLFSDQVYWRMLKTYSYDFSWVAGIFNLVLLGALLSVKQRYASKALFWLLSVSWAWLAWRFYIIEYGSINWFARYIGAFCLLITPVFIALAIRVKDQFTVVELALLSSTIVYVVLVRPILLKALGYSWQFSGIGLLPVPTLLTCIGLLLSIRFRFQWMVITLLSLILTVEVITLFMLQDPLWQEGPVILAALLMIAYSGKYKPLAYLRR